MTNQEVLIEAKSRMIGILERNLPEHPAITSLTLELIQLLSMAMPQETNDIALDN